MELRPSTLQKKTYSFESYDKAFQKYIQKRSRIRKACKVVVRFPHEGRMNIGYLSKTKRILKHPKIKNFEGKHQLSNIAKGKNLKNHQAIQHSGEKREKSKIKDINFGSKEESRVGQRESLSANEEQESFLDSIHEELREQNQRRPYFRCKINDFWILKSQFITKKYGQK